MKVYNKNANTSTEQVEAETDRKQLKKWLLKVRNDILSMETQLALIHLNDSIDENRVIKIKAAKFMQELLEKQIVNKLKELVPSISEYILTVASTMIDSELWEKVKEEAEKRYNEDTGGQNN
jgi:hypothetical protein